MKAPSNGLPTNPEEGEKKNINSELWHACAGPLVSMPPVGSLVVYFPQGHSEQVAATMQKETDSIPNYPSLPSKLICVLHNVILHADPETDEVYAQMTLQPVNKYDKDALLASDLGLKQSRQPAEFFCKTLTASDTSTHGGFSVPRRAAEKIFPPLDFSMQPPAQELVAKDLHDATWTFRHVYRGQPKRHLLTTGWSVFVSTKRLLAGDSVLFIRDEKSQLLLGIRRANRQQPALSSSVLSSDSMHIGILAAAAHAAANNSPFTIFYNPRASPSEFVIPLAKYNKAMYTQVSLGMRFRMMFETEESGVRRYMGTITGISDVDPVRWKNSQWRNLQVGWDESTAGERQNRVSIWEIEPVATPFYICPPPYFRSKLANQPGMPDDAEIENFKRAMPWLSEDINFKDVQNPLLSSMNLVQWMNMQRNPQLMASASQSPYFPSMMASILQNNIGAEDQSRLLNFQTHAMPLPANLQFNAQKPTQVQQFEGLQQAAPLIWSQLQQQQQQQPQQLLLQQQQQQPQQLLLQQQQQQQLVIQSPQQRLQQATILPQQQSFPPSILSPQTHQSSIPMQPQQQQHQTPVHLQQLSPILQQQQIALQQKQILSPTHPPTQQQQQQLKPPNQQSLQQQQHLQEPSLQQMQQPQIRSTTMTTGIIEQQQQRPSQPFSVQASTQVQPFSNQILQSMQTQIPLQTMVTSSMAIQQSPNVTNLGNLQQVTVPQNIHFQQQLELQHSMSPKQQQQPPSIMPSQNQLQLLQKLQQQQQILSQLNPQVFSQLSQPQLALQQSQLFQQQKQLLQQPSSVGVLFPELQKDAKPSTNHVDQIKPQLPHRDPLTVTNGEAPSCSTSPHSTFHVSSANLLNRSQSGSAVPTNNMVQEHQCRTDGRAKPELQHCKKEPDNPPFRNAVTDQLEASSSATSFCMDKSGEESFSLPPICIDGEVQADTRNNIFGSHMDGITPDTLLSRGFGSGKDLQNLLAGYGNQKDLDTEISTAAISSQSFGLPDVPFKPGYLNDAVINENGALNRGAWSNQPHRLRTYTKVQKRGSVGRSIDITRYRGYDDLRHDLACMFGIDGQLEDPHRSEWKLVYVDHENDILLVGDDPWEEFVSCVQSIKILSAVEVQQMSLEGDLGGAPVQNEACSGSDNGNMWRGHSFAG